MVFPLKPPFSHGFPMVFISSVPNGTSSPLCHLKVERNGDGPRDGPRDRDRDRDRDSREERRYDAGGARGM